MFVRPGGGVVSSRPQNQKTVGSNPLQGAWRLEILHRKADLTCIVLCRLNKNKCLS
jgi:hypothetical protein